MKPNPPIKSQRSMAGRCHRAGWARKRFLWSALLPCLALFGCAPESELRRLDPALTEVDLRQGKIAVLGVVKFQEPDQVRPPLNAMLERTFREERRDIPLIPADSVRRALGGARYGRLLLGYEYQGTLDAPALSEIADSLRGAARFLLLARIDKDRTRNSTRGISSADTGVAGGDVAMGITGRDAHVVVHLYDLTRRALVLSAAYEGSSEDSKPMLSPVRPGGRPGVNLELGPAVSPEEQGYPGVPDLAMALQEPFREFARALPPGPSPRAPSSAPRPRRRP